MIYYQFIHHKGYILKFYWSIDEQVVRVGTRNEKLMYEHVDSIRKRKKFFLLKHQRGVRVCMS